MVHRLRAWPRAPAAWCGRCAVVSLRSSTSDGSKSGTSPAIWLVTREGSKAVIVRTPDSPATSRYQKVCASLPSGVTAPMPGDDHPSPTRSSSHEPPGADRGGPVDVAGQAARADLLGDRPAHRRSCGSSSAAGSLAVDGQQRPAGRRRRRRRRSRSEPGLTISLRPSSRTSATWVWPQAMTRASVRVTRWIVVGRLEVGRQARRLAARGGVADEHEQVVHPMRAARPAGGAGSRAARRRAGRAPTRRRRGGRRDLVEPREGGRVVAVRDGDVGVALDDVGAGRIELAGPAPARPTGRGPLRTRSPVMAMAIRVGRPRSPRGRRPARPRCRGCRPGGRCAPAISAALLRAG